MSEHVTELGTFVEGVTDTITFTIKDQNGTGFRPDTLTITLFDEESGQTINSRNDQALTPVSAYVTTAGLLTFDLAVADVVLVNTYLRKISEVHRLIFKWTWLSATRVGYFVGNFIVEPRNG